MTIENNCLIAANCNIMDSNGHETLMDNSAERIKRKDKAMGGSFLGRQIVAIRRSSF